MHARLFAANNFVKLAEAATELGLADTLELPVPAALDLVPRKDPWAATMIAALVGRYGVRSMRELLTDPRPQAWLFSHGRERAQQVVALLRRYLDARAKERGIADDDEALEAREAPEVHDAAEAPEVREARGEADAPAKEKRKKRWPDTEAALVAWAAERDVEAHLDDPIGQAVTDPKHPVRHVAYGAYGRHKLRHVLVPESLAGPTGDERALATQELLEDQFTKRELGLLREAAWSYLETRAAELARGLEEERALEVKLATPPVDPGASKIFDVLLRARRQVRAVARPRPRDLVGDAKLAIQRSAAEDGQLVLTWSEPEDLDRPHLSKLRPSHVTITVDPFEDLAIKAQCACTPGKVNACVHALAMIDHLLAATLARDEVVEPLLELIRRPRWARALAAVDRVEERVGRRGERGEEQRLWWQLSPGLAGLELQAWLQQRGKRGDFLKAKPIPLDRLAKQPESWTLPADAKVVELFGGSPQAAKSYVHVRRALVLLAGHPRVFYGEHQDVPIDVRRCSVELVADEEPGGGLVLAPRLDGRALDRTELRALVDDATKNELIVRLDADAHKCVLITLDEEQRALLGVLVRHGYQFPAEARDELLRRLPVLGRHVSIAVPAALGRHQDATEQLVLRMEPEETVLRVDAIVRPVESGPQFPPGEGPHEVLGARGSELVTVRRDLERERVLAAKWLTRLELEPNAEAPHFTWVLAIERALGLIERLGAPAIDAHELVVEWPKGNTWKVSRRAGSSDLKVAVRDERDWFGVDGEVDVDGTKVALGLLLEAARKNRAFVEVKAGEWIAIADELRARLGKVEDVVIPTKDKLEVAKAGALALEELVANAGEATLSERFRDLITQVERVRREEPVVPATLDAELREYQREGFAWMSRLSRWGAGAVLADDMGLGKTVQALAVLTERAALGPQLVVAPTSVCFNWVREAKRFARDLEPVLYRELGPAGLAARIARPEGAASVPAASASTLEATQLGPRALLVVSYGLLARDAELFAKVPFASVVFDEAQAIKNYATRRARAARGLDAAWRLALTGTPIENHLGELWSIFRAISPGLLGSWDWFRTHFAVPIERDRDVERRRALARTLRPFILRRTKAEVLSSLPPRTEIEVEIELSPDERRLYDAVRLAALTELEEAKEERAELESAVRDARAKAEKGEEGLAELAVRAAMGDEGAGAQRFRVLAAITRLRLLACHPALYDEKTSVPSSKLARFMELVRALREEGHRALVFSQFTKHLALVRRALDAERISYLYLDGSTPAAERERLVDAFQHGDTELFLISLKAGGTGLNLTAADYVFHLDPWWNPAVEDQATDRAHRIGQEQPVTVYRLVARGTIEQAIVALHGEKRELVRDVLEGTDAAARVTTDELVRLIREGFAGPSDGDAEIAALEGETATFDGPSAFDEER
ncbi:DEAD/DEAH box helicase [Myxococcota bacterium]|nr:DEAD/DEAH box helicase [Myxococcota bacterium]